MVVYRFARAVIRWVLLPAQMRLRVVGAERCPQTGALIIVSNHLGLVDPLVIACHVRRPIRILAKVEIFRWPVLGWLARWCRIVPVRRGESDRVAMRTLAAVLAEGQCIMLMPEGTYPKVPLPPEMLPVKTGAAFLALHTRACVLPVGVTGTQQVWSARRGWRFWRRPRVTVTFGTAYQPEVPVGLPAKQTYQFVADDMARRIAALLPDAYRGHYANTAQEANTADTADTSDPVASRAGLVDVTEIVAAEPQAEPNLPLPPLPSVWDGRADRSDAGLANPQGTGQNPRLEA